MANETLQTLYIDELRDLYSAEQQLVKALPKLVKNAETEELSDAIANHLEETKNQVTRLEQIFEKLDESPKGKKCVGMEGLIKEGAEVMDEFEGKVLDAGLISAAQRVEHYEIAAYGTVCTFAAIIGAAQRVEHYEMAAYGTARTFAELLGEEEDVSLLEQTLQEEKQADEKLTQLSENINTEARDSSAEESDTRKEPVRSRKSRSAA